MLPELLPPSFKQLSPAPLQLVVCQVRHEPLVFDDQSPWFSLHKALKDEYPVIEPHTVHEVAVNVSPQGAQVSGEPENGFRLQSSDGAWTVALLPTFFALECTGYTRWTDFHRRFEQLVPLVAEHLGPKLEQRLGLRFVDKLAPTAVARPSDWATRLNPAMAGALKHPTLGPRITGTQSLVQLREGSFDVLLRHGVQPESDPPAYVIDTDCARQGGRLFEVDQLMADTGNLHTLALQVFQSCLESEYLNSLEEES